MIEGYDSTGNLLERWTESGYERFQNGQVVESRSLTDDEARRVEGIARINAASQAEQERQAALAAPLTPPAIDGDTVAEVRASAEAAVADLAQQMTERLSLLGGV
jgi:hypothetical protein